MHSVTSGSLFSTQILNVVLPHVPAKNWISLACVNQELVERMHVCFFHGIYSWGGAHLEASNEIFLHACKKGHTKLVICYLTGKRQRESLKSCLNTFSEGFKTAVQNEQDKLLISLLDFIFQLSEINNADEVIEGICDAIIRISSKCKFENDLSYALAIHVKGLIKNNICLARRFLALTHTYAYWNEIVLSAIDCLCSQTKGELVQALELFPPHEKIQIRYCGLPSKDRFYHLTYLAKLIAFGYRNILANVVDPDFDEEDAFLQLIEIAKTFGITLEYGRLEEDVEKLKGYDIVSGSFLELFQRELPANKCCLTTDDNDIVVGSAHGAIKFKIFKHDENPEWFMPWIHSLESLVFEKEVLNFAFVANANVYDYWSGNGYTNEPRYLDWNSSKSYLFNAIQALQRENLKAINLYLYLGKFDSKEAINDEVRALLDFFMRLMPNKNLKISINLLGSYLEVQNSLIYQALDVFIMTSEEEFLVQATHRLMQKRRPQAIQYYIYETEDHDEDKVWSWSENSSSQYFTS